MEKPSERILLCKPKMSGTEIDFIRRALEADWAVPMGPDVDAFEKELSQMLGAENIVALASGTAAVHLALLGAGVEAGDEVMVQSFTFCASTNPVVYIGAKPVFVDSEPESWNMDPKLLDEAIADRLAVTGRLPRAIVVVALYGMPYRIGEILEIGRRWGIPVIEDAAEGLGSRINGKALGTFGQFGVLSFNGNKMITTSGGGALICPDPEARRRAAWLATQARESYPYYQHEAVGFNYRMSNVSACIGRGQLSVFEQYIAHHRRVQELYCQLLDHTPAISVHRSPRAEYEPNYWLCTATLDENAHVEGQEEAYSTVGNGAIGGAAGVVHQAAEAQTDCQPNANVEALRMALNKAGIESRPLWKPMHRQPVFSHCTAYVNGVSDNLFRRGICLPAGPHVTDDHVRYIAETIKKSLK